MAKAKRVKQSRRSKSGWGRFIQDNAEKASEKAKDTDKNYLAVLSGWWKEVPQEVKDSYNKNEDFKHIFGTDAPVTKKPAEKAAEEPKVDAAAEPETESTEPATEADSAEPSTEEPTEEKSTESTEPTEASAE